jgi:hypothetical protein
MSTIGASVGKGGANALQDVLTVQVLLNDNARKLTPLPALRVDGRIGPKTVTAIETFQKRVMSLPQLTGKVDPNSLTFTALLRCGCDQPTENFPYREETFAVIAKLAPLINKYSGTQGVPPIAVAGSIADEFNTMTGVKGVLDWFQDNVLLNYMPNSAIQTDVRLGFNSKLLNATKHDLGKGNIKLETAKYIYDQFKSKFANKNMNYADLVDYLRSDEGTVHIASLVIKKASIDMASYVKGLSAEKTEAIYVTYYKQGPSYIARFKAATAADPHRHLEPGEGCRVILQRARFVKALGLD